MIEKYDLAAGCDVPKFGLGMKEIWEVDPERHNEGEVTHSLGWPLGFKNSGGSFLYHLDNNQVYVGYIVDLNYKNPYLSPYMEFQRFKHHPKIAKLLKGGKRIAYGARAVTKGGAQSLPKVAFPGGALLGDANGEPTGAVRNRGVALYRSAVPPLSEARLQRRLVNGLKLMADAGYTAVHHAGVDTI